MAGEFESFIFDPRAFIAGPYLDCPFCGSPDSFGVLMFGGGGGYTRRCRDCVKDERFQLPPLQKKALYLDQFVVSNLIKVLHAASRAPANSWPGRLLVRAVRASRSTGEAAAS